MKKTVEEYARDFYGKDIETMEIEGKPIYVGENKITMVMTPNHPIEFMKDSTKKISLKDMSILCQIYETGGSGDFIYDVDGVFVNKNIFDGINTFISQNDLDAEIFINEKEKMSPIVIKGKDIAMAIAPVRQMKEQFYAKGTLDEFKKLGKKSMKVLRDEILSHPNHTYQRVKEIKRLERDSKDTLICKRMFLDHDVFIK